MRSASRSLSVLTLGLGLLGCSGDRGVQPISGRILLASFPGALTGVRASRPGAPAIEAAIGSDGAFLLPLGAGRRYRIDFPMAGGSASLVYPRKAGSTDFRFHVRGGGARFDLGMVRYMGTPDQLTVVFKQAQTATPATDPGPDVDCENGRDEKTGAVCADDNHQDEGDSCDEGESGPDDPADSAPPAGVAVADQNIPPAVGSCGGDGEQEGD
jgi:hypothetical protein